MAAGTPGRRAVEERRFDIAALLVLGLCAFALRVAPIGDVSLWWDELVHVQTSSKADVLSVFEAVKLGIPPGLGNAGAVPLDYLLLHGWIRLAPRPSVDGIEAYYRTPALLWSVATVLLTYVYARRFFDRGLALVAGTILAASVSHSLYAAEARSYSLFAMMSVVNLYAFATLVLRRTEPRVWVAYTVVSLLYFATGFLSLLVTLGQYVILGLLLVLDLRDEPRPRSRESYVRIAFPLGSGLAVLAAVGAYLHGTFLGARHGRSTEALDTWERTYTALQFFANENPLLLAAFGAGVVLLVLHERRRERDRLAIVIALVAAFLAIPIIVEIERWKEYYFHPRHAYFLLPAFALVAAGGLLNALRGLDPLRRTALAETSRRATYTAVALAAVLATQVSPVLDHLRDPAPWFNRTKTARHFKSLMRQLQDRVAALEPGEVYLLVAERRRPGHIGNPVLAKYLQWYGLDDRVVLRGTDDPLATREDIARICPDGCRGQPTARVQRRLRATGPFNANREMLELVGVSAAPQTGAPLGGLGLVHYWRFRQGPPSRAPEFRLTRHSGLTLLEKEPRADADTVGTR